jgi:hypothetical protein
MTLFSVAWNTPGAPEKGIKYTHLTEAKEKLSSKNAGSVRTVEIENDGEVRRKITDIIGSQFTRLFTLNLLGQSSGAALFQTISEAVCVIVDCG